MHHTIMPYLKLTQLFLIIAYCYLLVSYYPRKKKDKILMSILTFSIIIEIAVFTLCVYGNNEVAVSILYSSNAILHNSLWLFMMVHVLDKPYVYKMIIPFYVVFGIVNLFFFQGFSKFNHYTFILGALLYLILFINESFYLLKKENLTFFQSNDYLLLFAPIVFFLGYSLISGFNNQELSKTEVLGTMSLYDLVGYFINLIYYSIIIIYISKEKKHRND